MVIFVLHWIILLTLSVCFAKEFKAAVYLHSRAKSCSQQCEFKIWVSSVAS